MSFAPSPYAQRQPLWRRGGIGALVVLVHVLMLALLLRLAPPPDFSGRKGSPTIVTLLPDAQEEREAARQARAARPQAARPARDQPDRPPVPLPPPPLDLPPSAADAVWRQVMPMSRSELAAADVSRLPARTGAGNADDGKAEGEAGRQGDGMTGPNGEPLYNAEWARKPTDAELSGYLPSTRPASGWGMVACRTIPGNRVEDCVELGQSPPGSGLARAVRQAAWQFRVLPPRIGGRAQVGAWVRIRIDYSTRPAE